MIYLYWYLGICAVFIAFIVIHNQLTKSPNDDRIDDLLRATDPDRNRWWWMPTNYIVAPMLTIMLVLTIWPIVIYWEVKGMIDARRPKIEESPKKFAVTSEHLQKQWSVAEIETAEVVIDPLGAAPRVPFGHLNPAWETL